MAASSPYPKGRRRVGNLAPCLPRRQKLPNRRIERVEPAKLIERTPSFVATACDGEVVPEAPIAVVACDCAAKACACGC